MEQRIAMKKQAKEFRKQVKAEILTTKDKIEKKKLTKKYLFWSKLIVNLNKWRELNGGERQRLEKLVKKIRKGIEEGFAEQGGIEEIDEIDQGQSTGIGVLEGDENDHGHRHDQEHEQEQADQDGHRPRSPLPFRKPVQSRPSALMILA